MSESNETSRRSGELVPLSVVENEAYNEVSQYTGPRFEDFGGLDREIERLQEVGAVLTNPELAHEWDLQIPTGILLCGPGGVGKTELVQALSYDIQAELMEVNVSDILGGYVGEANKSLKQVFANAAAEGGPVIIFFDEMDGLFAKESSGNRGVSTSLLSEMKIRMTKLRDEQPKTLIAGATNDISGFDESLLRAGRFDVVLQIPRPDLSTRSSIFAKVISRHPDLYISGLSDFSNFKYLDDLETQPVSEGIIDTRVLAEAADGLTGADIKSILHKARMNKFMAKVKGIDEIGPLSQRDILKSIDEHRKQRLTTM
jgi:transitional endoplasmic reticulum ATPase